MKRVVWILVALLVVVAVALTLNTITVNNETKAAETTADGAQILELSSGDVQVVETPAETDKPKAPIVLIHGYAASLHWWDGLVPLLAEEHRVITLDLLGHGGSEKPAGGYSMEDQAGLVAEALNQLRVQGAVVVGHSLGGNVAAALATQSSELVDRVVIVDSRPSDDVGPGLPFLAKVGYLPVIGQLLNRVAPDSAIEDSYAEGFAPGYDIESGFENPDQVVEDFRDMTYTSFEESRDAADDYLDEAPLDERLADAAVPVMVIFGSEDQIVNTEEALAAFEGLPGLRTATIDGSGHSPQVENPEETAGLIEEFAADAGDEVLAPPPQTESAGNAAGGGKGEKGGRENQKIKGKGRKARQKEETQEDAPNADKPEDGGGAGGDGPNAEKGQKPPSNERPGGG